MSKHRYVDPESDLVTLTLTRNDAGQILEGLRERKHTWDNTVLHEEGNLIAGTEDCTIEQCSGIKEAKAVVAHYRKIISQIEAQLARPRSQRRPTSH